MLLFSGTRTVLFCFFFTVYCLEMFTGIDHLTGDTMDGGDTSPDTKRYKERRLIQWSNELEADWSS